MIVCLVTKKVYFGSTSNARKRINQHELDLKLNRHRNSYLQNAWNKYGENNFEAMIYEKCSAEERILKEQECIDTFKSSDPSYGFNVDHPVKSLMPSQLRSQISKDYWNSLTEEEKEIHVSKISSYWDNPEWVETKGKIAKENLAKFHFLQKNDPEYRNTWSQNVSDSNKNPIKRANNSEYLKKQWENPEFRSSRIESLNRPDVIEKQSQISLERWQDPAYREKHAFGMKGVWTEERKQDHSKILTESWKNPELLEKQSKDSLKKWQDPAYREKRAASLKTALADPEVKARKSETAKLAWLKRKSKSINNDIVQPELKDPETLE